MIDVLRVTHSDCEWKACQIGFGYYRYVGRYKGARLAIQSFAHLSPRYDGDDNSFTSMWHVFMDNEDIGRTQVQSHVPRLVQLAKSKRDTAAREATA